MVGILSAEVESNQIEAGGAKKGKYAAGKTWEKLENGYTEPNKK